MDRRRYSEADLRILADPIEGVRRLAGHFFSRGAFDPAEVVARLTFEALVCGVRSLVIERAERWWIIRGDADWLTEPDKLRSFYQIVSYAQGGDNSTRSEVLLNAFASDVVTASGGGVDVIKGTSDATIDEYLALHRDAGRVVAFAP